MENMNEFIAKVKETLVEMLPERVLKEAVLEEKLVVKENDEVLHGLNLVTGENEISPLIFCDELFERYKKGEDLKDLLRNAVIVLSEDPGETPKDLVDRLDIENVEGRLTLRLLEADRNRRFLEEIPHLDVGNGFVYVCEIRVDSPIGGYWKTTVNNTLMNDIGYDKERLFREAFLSSPKLSPAVMLSTLEIIMDMDNKHNVLENEKVLSDKEKDRLYVLTSEDRAKGASVLYYPGMMEKIGRVLGEGYYAVPSSMDEFLIIPDSVKANPKRLKSSVSESNSIKLKEGDKVLSDNIYHYDRETGVMKTV